MFQIKFILLLYLKAPIYVETCGDASTSRFYEFCIRVSLSPHIDSLVFRATPTLKLVFIGSFSNLNITVSNKRFIITYKK